MISKLPREIILIIASTFSAKEIRSCSRVSKEWLQIFEYFRWIHIQVALSTLKTLKEDEMTYWKDNGYRSRYLWLIYKEDHATKGKPRPRPKTKDNDDNGDYHIENIKDAQDYFPNIKSLRFDYDEKRFPISMLFENGHGWSSLTHLKLGSFGESGTIPCDDLDGFFQCLPNLTDLRLDSIDIGSCVHFDLNQAVTPAKLKVLEIKNGSVPYRLAHYCSRKFPELHSVVFDTIDECRISDVYSFSFNGRRDFWTGKYLLDLEAADIRIKDSGGNAYHVRCALWNLEKLLSCPLHKLSLTLSVHINQNIIMKMGLFSRIPALTRTLRALDLDISTPLDKPCFSLNLSNAPCLEDLNIRYLGGTIDFQDFLSKSPVLKRAILELQTLTFRNKLDEPHGLESIELIGLSITSEVLENISASCTQIQTIKISPAVDNISTTN
ncbi:hypothetical protein J3Q64DRAFT_1757942 [Phycomyces blakesleeanus]|uniref:F-box domain-containing protein n=2 Tax=Phycomyces blakesleeanus TaxID=4837 RepID=A0A162TS05_PHYB8|nr:hypothetical protein PHYBLDRAFT_149701 [Phycomyces blakesleeanus NRRL 1555(-)]OAD69303.1 hypothetical protein PHYBLDRAFT_149701 [Phycomyces blakesleeanus NRRL 1555(-)]|eukprot:XP_018287343.1 hypothetical protein PHYBLDRAFT_149701 [Phycomyces blakesleeanus NRRL 1555(-)]